MATNKFPLRPSDLGFPLFDWLDRLARRHETSEYPTFKTGTFTYDTSTASGNVTVTGVGFEFRALLMISLVTGASRLSLGVHDGTNGYGFYDNFNVSADTWGKLTAGTAFNFLESGGGANVSVALSSKNSDGFVLAMTKSGAPTGTADFFYLAMR